MAANKTNARVCEYAQNVMHNLRAQLIQFIDQQKVAKQAANRLINVSIYDSTRYTIVQALSTYLRMSKIKSVIYRPDLHSLRTT